MVLGFTQELSTPAGGGEEADADVERQLAAMGEALPHLTAMVATELHSVTDPTLGWCDSQVEFEFTLDLLRDGLERSLLLSRVSSSPDECPSRQDPRPGYAGHRSERS